MNRSRNSTVSTRQHKSTQNAPVRVSKETFWVGCDAMHLFAAHAYKHYYEAVGTIASANASDRCMEHMIQHFELLGWKVTETPTESGTEIKFVLPIELGHSFIAAPLEQQEVASPKSES